MKKVEIGKISFIWDKGGEGDPVTIGRANRGKRQRKSE